MQAARLVTGRILKEGGFRRFFHSNAACNSRICGPAGIQPSSREVLLKVEASQAVEGVDEKLLATAVH
jgi:hypothetical protein